MENIKEEIVKDLEKVNNLNELNDVKVKYLVFIVKYLLSSCFSNLIGLNFLLITSSVGRSSKVPVSEYSRRTRISESTVIRYLFPCTTLDIFGSIL